MNPENDTITIPATLKRTAGVKVIQRAFTTCAFDKEAPLPVQISEPTNPERVIRFRASDDSLDRHNEVVLPEGWEFGNFMKNPVMMQFHDYGTMPIGKVVAVGVVDNALYVDGEFDPPEWDEVAEQVFQKIKHGTISAGSVGFIPKEIATPGTKRRDLFDRYPQAERVYVKQELLEWSICPIPANPNAIAAHAKELDECVAQESGAESDEVTAVEMDAEAVGEAVAMRLWDMSWGLKHPKSDVADHDVDDENGE